MQALLGNFQNDGRKMHAKILLDIEWCVMCILLFLTFYNCSKGICRVFLKEAGQMFLYFTY